MRLMFWENYRGCFFENLVRGVLSVHRENHWFGSAFCRQLQLFFVIVRKCQCVVCFAHCVEERQVRRRSVVALCVSMQDVVSRSTCIFEVHVSGVSRCNFVMCLGEENRRLCGSVCVCGTV